MELLFILGAVQAVFLSIMLASKGAHQIRDKFLIAWMLFLGIHLGGVYLAATGFYRRHPQWFGIDSAMILLEGPFLYLYVGLAIGKIKTLKPIFLLHAIPYLFFTSYLLVMVHTYRGTDLYRYITLLIGDTSNRVLYLFGFFNHFHLIVYLALSIMVLRGHARKIADAFSYTEEVNMQWLLSVVVGFALISATVLLGLLINDLFQFVSHNFKAYMIYTAFSLLPFYFSFVAIRQQIFYTPEMSDYKKYEDSTLDPSKSKVYASQLTALMEEHKPYLNGKLTISDLADRMNISSKHLSQVINENFDQNFFKYVNSYRVEEARKRMQDPKYNHLKLLSIGLDCGFNTKSSFNSIFKKFTGTTPSAYRESLPRSQS